MLPLKFIGVYEATRVPRFNRNGSPSAKPLETSLAGMSLWNAAQIYFVQTLGYSVEYRICTPPIGGSTISIILCSNSDGRTSSEADRQATEAFEQLLPEEYGWRRSPAFWPENFRTLVERQADQGWRIARVIRRVNFVGLPRVAQRSIVSVSAGGSPPSSPGTSSPGAARLRTGEFSGIGPRILPHFERREMLRDLRRSSPCLPSLGYLTQADDVPHRLFRELQHAAPVIVSLAIHPVNRDALLADRVVATAWSHLIQLMKQGAAEAGNFDSTAIDGAFQRYWLPERYLANLTVRVATPQAMQSIGVAQQICARFGGLMAFEVMGPTTEGRERGNPIEYVDSPDVDVPTPRWEKEEWASERAFWSIRLEEAGIEVPADEDHRRLDFLARFPHLYTLEEIQQLMGLPVADEEGLAGIDSQMLSPFNAPQVRHAPVTVMGDKGLLEFPAEPDRVRVGIIRTKPVLGGSVERPDPGTEHWHTILKEDLSKHALIVGSTGSGKTMTTLFFVRELFRLGVPFMVIEPVKTEYFDRLKNKLTSNGKTAVKRYNFEGGVRGQGERHARPSNDFLAFDPMRLQSGVTVARHASYLKSCFEAAFPLAPIAAQVLQTGLLEYYTDPPKRGGCGLSPFDAGGKDVHCVRKEKVFPSLRTFIDFFCGEGDSFISRAFPSRGTAASAATTLEWVDSFRRRFRNLDQGMLGTAARLADTLYYNRRGIFSEQYEMFSKCINDRENTIVELDAIPDPEQKSLVMAFLLTFLFERRQADDQLRRQNGGQAGTVPLQHVLVVEEAHRLLANVSMGSRNSEVASGLDSRAKAVALFVDMLAEVRAYGQGIAIVEQIPMKIVSDAVKNTNLKIMLRLTSADDRDYLGAAMNFTEEQKQFVTGLRARGGEGIQFVAFEEGIDQPRLLTLPLPNKGAGGKPWLYDEFF